MKNSATALRATAFLTRSIRQESRQFSHHLMRGALASVILILILMQLATVSLFGAAGHRLASLIMTTSYWFLTLVGTLYFSVAITEEKEEETLPLLRMTGVTSFSLVAGKSLPRLAVAVLFILVGAPFLVLSITMGGLIIEQLLACLAGLMCYAFLLCQLGVLASTMASTGRSAFARTAVLWFLLELGHLLLMLAESGVSRQKMTWLADALNTASAWLRERSAVMSLDDYLVAGRGDSWWSPQMTFHLCAGCACCLFSCLLFNPYNDRVTAMGAAADRGLLAPMVFRRGRKSARAREPVLAWKSWHFIVGGWRWLLFRLVAMPVGAILLVGSIGLIWNEPVTVESVCSTLMVISGVLFFIELARSTGRVLNDEGFQQTMSSLWMLPRSAGRLLWPLVAGALPAAVPAACCFGLAWILYFQSRSYYPVQVSDLLEFLAEPWTWVVVSWVITTVHLGLLLSTWLRYGGMVVATALLWIAFPIMMQMLMFVMFVALAGPTLPGMETFVRYVLPIGLIFISVVGWVGLQQLIVRRVQDVCGR